MKKLIIYLSLIATIGYSADVILGNISALTWTGTGANKVASFGTPDVLNGLVARWTFDAITNNIANDDSGNGNYGTLSSGVIITNGLIGSAVRFISSDPSRIILNNSNLTNIKDGNWSVSFWIKDKSTVSIYGGIVVFNGAGVVYGSETQYSILLSDNANLLWTAPSDSVWHNIVITRQGTTYSQYTDGVLQSSSYFLDSGWGTSGLYEIGRGYNYPTYRTTQTLDDIRIYNRLLSSNEVATIYNKFK